MTPPGWLQASWTATGLCLAGVLGAAGAWAGLNGGPVLGGVAAVGLVWGVLYWVAGRPGRLLGALLLAGASGGAVAALLASWFAPLWAAWAGPDWILGDLGRLALAAAAGVALGGLAAGRAGEPALAFPEAAALAGLVEWPGEARRWAAPAALAVLAGTIRFGVSAGWWPGLVSLAADGRGAAGLAGLAVAPGLLGIGLLLGRNRAAALAAGSLAVGLGILPTALAFGPQATVAPGLVAPASASGLDLQASYGVLAGLGAVAVALGGSLAVWLVRLGRTWRRAGWLAVRPKVGQLAGALAVAALGVTALWPPPGVSWAAVPALGAGAALVVAVAVAAAAELGGPVWPVLGLPALAVAVPTLVAGLGGRTVAVWGFGGDPGLVGGAGALAVVAALFAADCLQARRVNLLLEVSFPLLPLKMASALAGLAGAAVAVSALAVPVAGGQSAGLAGAGLVSRVALAGAGGRLPGGLMLAGAALGGVPWLLGRPAWPVALGTLLPLPLAATLLLGGLVAGEWRGRAGQDGAEAGEGARRAGVALLLGDLAVQGVALFLVAWRIWPAPVGGWSWSGSTAGGLAGRLAGLGALAVLTSVAVWLAWRRPKPAPLAPGLNNPERAAGNALPPA